MAARLVLGATLTMPTLMQMTRRRRARRMRRIQSLRD